jgi:hypothetical protein
MSERDFVKEDLDRFELFRDTHERLAIEFKVTGISDDALLIAAATLHQSDVLSNALSVSAGNLAALCRIIEDKF